LPHSEWKPKFINVEGEFTKFVLGFRGGKKLVDATGPIPNGFLNADYYFAKDEVIIELKCLSENAGNPEVESRRIMDSARHLGFTPFHVLRLMMSGNPELQKILRHAHAKKIRTVVEAIKKANKQIRASKLILERPNARGLIALANDNNYGLTPSEAMSAVVKAFNNISDCHCDCVVYFTPNVLHDIGDKVAYNLWIPLYNVGSEIFSTFVNEFGTAWGDYVHNNIEPLISRIKNDSDDISKTALNASIIAEFKNRK